MAGSSSPPFLLVHRLDAVVAIDVPLDAIGHVHDLQRRILPTRALATQRLDRLDKQRIAPVLIVTAEATIPVAFLGNRVLCRLVSTRRHKLGALSGHTEPAETLVEYDFHYAASFTRPSILRQSGPIPNSRDVSSVSSLLQCQQ